MNLLTRVKAAKNALFSKVTAASLPAGVMEWMMRQGKDPDISQVALVRKYWGWVYACAQLSAARFASTPLKVYASRAKGQSKVKNFRARPVGKSQANYLRKRLSKSLQNVGGAEDFEELEEHPLIDLLQKVNDQENGYELKELTQVMLDLTGNAYWMLEKDKFNVPTKLFCLRSQWVKIQPDKANFVKGYLYGCDGNWQGEGQLQLEPEQVIHFKYPHPSDPWYGMGPVQAAAYAIESLELREKFVLATMGNMARPDLIVKYLEGELDPRDRVMLEREWNSMLKGTKNAGKVKVTDFRYEIDKVGWNPNELKFNEGEEWILRKICSAFPVPEGLIDSSSISKAPRAGMEGTELFMAQNNTLPRCTRFEEKLNEKLCPLYDERLFVAFDNPVPKDRVAQLNEDNMRLTTAVITINEVREREGLDPVPWGDKPIQIQQQETQAEQAEKDRQAGVERFDEFGNPLPPLDDATGSEDGPGGHDPESNDQADDESPRGANGQSGGGSPFGKKKLARKGGAGSGHFGHSGRPGKVGGSDGDGHLDPPSSLQEARENTRKAEAIARDAFKKLQKLKREAARNMTSLLEASPYDERIREQEKEVDRLNAVLVTVRNQENEWWDKKSFDPDGMTMEVDGQHISPELAGIPIRLKPRRRFRNERGEFDLLDPDRVRASRETVEALR